MHLLRIDASARVDDSVTRALANRLTAHLQRHYPAAMITRRDLREPPPFVTNQWVTANFTDEPQRSAAQRATLATSAALVDELSAADAVIIATPIYNFAIPAALKAWVDMVARVGLTFRYTDQGPRGLLANRPVYVVIASGGTPIGSGIDYATPYLRHIFGFMGITDVRIIDAADAERTLRDALAADAPSASANAAKPPRPGS